MENFSIRGEHGGGWVIWMSEISYVRKKTEGKQVLRMDNIQTGT
jgi:hypothetical protein